MSKATVYIVQTHKGWMADTTARTAPMCAWTRSKDEAVRLSMKEVKEEVEVLSKLGVEAWVVKVRLS